MQAAGKPVATRFYRLFFLRISMRFLGIDLGTASLKLAIVDEDGHERAFASVAYAVTTPFPGWAETPVESWWNALRDAAARLPARERGNRAVDLGCDLKPIAAPGVGQQP